jgi:hypothetical protein
MREFYEEIRYCGGSHTTPVSGSVVTNLDGAFSADRTLSDTHKAAEFFAVSSNYRACCDFRASSAADYSRITGK